MIALKSAPCLTAACLAMLAAAPSFGQSTAELLPGARLYQQKCATCHSLDVNKIGPAHRRVVGRQAGSAPGYSYSSALKASGIVWTADKLDAWLKGPQAMVKGTKMYLSVPNAADRAEIIAYLQAASSK